MSELMEFKCPCCGGAVEFNSTVQKMKCPYCDTEFEMEALKQYDEELKAKKQDKMKWDTNPGQEWEEGEADNMSEYICNSCGGEIICDETTAATQCPYCGNPVVMKGKLSGSLKPDYVIPFKLNKEDAKKGLFKHFKGKRFLPNVFKDENHIDEIKGVYVPFWLFDADADADIRYRATKVRHWSSGSYDYTETSHYSIIREGSIAFDNVPVDGSTQMPDDLMESIEPFDFSEAVDFQTAYLSGYLADKYDVTDEQSVVRANERIKNSTESSFRSTVKGYSSVTTEQSSVSLKNGKAKYALYPVWLLSTSWKDKNFLFAMNGQTGKFVGDLPVDWGKFWKWFGALTGILSIVTYGAMWLYNLL